MIHYSVRYRVSGKTTFSNLAKGDLFFVNEYALHYYIDEEISSEVLSIKMEKEFYMDLATSTIHKINWNTPIIKVSSEHLTKDDGLK